MNRRDTVTKHHSSAIDTENSIKDYLAMGAPPSKLNLGFAYYAKYFTTQGDCSVSALNCPIAVAEDAQGKDTLTSGAWTFERFHIHPVEASSLTVSRDGTCGPEKGTKCETGCCSQHGHCGTSPEHCNGACQHAFGSGCTDADVAASWQLAAKHGVTDEVAGGQYYFDATNRLFWTWDTPELITRKFDNIVRNYKLGGVMAWSLGEDSADWSHVRQMAKEIAKGGLGLTTASDSNMPVDGYMHDEIADYCCPNGYDPANLLIYQPVSMFPLSYHPFLVNCGDGKGLVYCACNTPECYWGPLHPDHYDDNNPVQSMLNEDGLVEMQYTEALQAMPTEPNPTALKTPEPGYRVFLECMGDDGLLISCPEWVTSKVLHGTATEPKPAAFETPSPTGGVFIECVGEHGGMMRCPQSVTDNFLSRHSSLDAAGLETPWPMHQNPTAVVTAAAIKTGFTTHIGIPQAQESEFSGGSYGMRRRERAQKA